MVLKASSASGTNVYQISGTNVLRALPEWIAQKRKRSLKHDAEYQTRVELIQDFEFSEALNRIRVLADGAYAMATGTYKPQIHVYDFANMALKFERHTDAENVDFAIVLSDWLRSVHLQNDRLVEFHVRGGLHHRLRIPTFGRGVCYNHGTGDLLVAAQGNQVYRLNLDQGRFLNPYTVLAEASGGVNHIDVNKVHGLVSCGLEDGTVEFWDPRSRQQVAKLDVGATLDEAHHTGASQVTATAFRNDGLSFACGLSSGYLLVYDLRAAAPLAVRDQGYGNPVHKVIWLDENSTNANTYLTADRQIAKVWDRHSGALVCSMEPDVDINDVEYIPDSGMFFMANEGLPMHTFYVPAIGPAPAWCSFLDNITEELEETVLTQTYSNYRFITREDVARLNIGHLVGKGVLKGYMHGYFIHTDLYDKVNLIANPNSIQDEREREVRRRIEKERESRIRTAGAAQAKVKVNRELVARLERKGGSDKAAAVVNDERFAEMFTDEAFAVDEQSHDFQQLNPVVRGKTAAEESDDEKIAGAAASLSSSESESESEADDAATTTQVKKRLARLEKQRQAKADTSKFLSEMRVLKSEELDTPAKATSFGKQVRAREAAHASTKSRKTDSTIKRGARGEAELTFVPKSSKKVAKPAPKSSGRDKQHFEGRRRALRNVFRGM